MYVYIGHACMCIVHVLVYRTCIYLIITCLYYTTSLLNEYEGIIIFLKSILYVNATLEDSFY